MSKEGAPVLPSEDEIGSYKDIASKLTEEAEGFERAGMYELSQNKNNNAKVFNGLARKSEFERKKLLQKLNIRNIWEIIIDK